MEENTKLLIKKLLKIYFIFVFIAVVILVIYVIYNVLNAPVNINPVCSMPVNFSLEGVK
jgi:hypothetical protein